MIKWPFGKIKDALAWLYNKIADALNKTEECDGKKYNPARLCCTVKGPMPRRGMNNLSDCAQRYTVRTPVQDGCHPGFDLTLQALRNGGDFNNPLGANGPDFKPVCNSHIWCYYGACSWDDDVKHKKACDVNFNQKMLGLCKEIKNLNTQEKCNKLKNVYYDKIAVEDGPKSYESSQKSNCSCCAKVAK
ncbi:MAG: hypothetical protein HY796_00515 [Elusimicrobia bacterium]|nr:hypothetical protein [Elusimicrobiota bacterium]